VASLLGSSRLRGDFVSFVFAMEILANGRE
jgi:hypothetical protein